jgi:ABC-2 type transport system ATP-binding protein
MLASLRGRTTVFFSTHILADVERICDTVAILDKGRVVVQAPIDELRSRYGASKVFVEVTDHTDELAEALRREPWVSEVSCEANGTLELKVTDDEAAQMRIPVMVAERGVGLKRLEAGEMGLEEVFVELVGGGSR